MDAEERARRFAAAAKAELAHLPRIQRDTLAEIVRQLETARSLIVQQLSAGASESATRRLRRLQLQVEHAIEDFRAAVTRAATKGVDAGWTAGVQSIATPFEVAGVSLTGASIDTRALMAARAFLTDRIQDISLRALNRLNSALTQNIIGAAPLSDTITQVQRILGGVPRARAMTVAYTEIGRVHSVAQDDVLQDAAAKVPNVYKRWQKSGKLHPRATHVAAHNQIRPHDQPYTIDGEQLRFPRDPNASAKNTINCGCLSVPVVDGSSFGAGTVRIDDAGIARIQTADGRLIRLPK